MNTSSSGAANQMATASDYNSMNEIDDLRVERLPEIADKQITQKKLLKVIILGDTGKCLSIALVLNGPF